LFFFRFTIIEANATGIIPWFVLSITSLVLFVSNGLVDYKNGVVLLIGMTIDGYVGAHTALKKGNAWIKQLFSLAVIVSRAQLLLF